MKLTPKLVTTYTHVELDPLNLKPEDINIQDIAHSLSMICRWSGHSNTFYSVAEHLLNCVALAIKDGVTDKFILRQIFAHDFTEYLLYDLTSPIKDVLPGYKEFEIKLYNIIAKKFNLPDYDNSSPLVKYYDLLCRDLEFQALFEDNKETPLLYGGDMLDTELTFLNAYEELFND